MNENSQFHLIISNTYQYNNSNWEDQLTQFNNDVITYDTIGNPLTIGENITLDWMNGRQLNQYVDFNNTVEYQYNKDGIRTSKTINNVKTEYYVEGTSIIFEKTGSNVIYYICNEVDGLIGLQYNTDKYYYLKNAQNDIIGILDSNYNIVAKYTYDSIGNILSITDGNGIDISNNDTHIGNINPFRYRSYYYDKETNLYYLNSRYYNPVWGRFLNADGIIGANKDINSYNLYAYVSNNPINNLDYSGNGRIKDFFIGIGKGFIKTTEKMLIGLCTAFTNPIYPTSSQLLAHSLQLNPSDVYLDGKSKTAKQIKKSKEFQDAIKTVVNENSNEISKYDKPIVSKTTWI